MRASAITSILFLAFFAACSRDDDHTAARADWLDVLERKRAAAGAGASSEAKQAYADSLAAFVRKHPRHGRGREVYQRIQLDFARELAERGRHSDAVRFYRAVLTHSPGNDEAARGLQQAVDALSVTRAELLQLRKGMTKKQVARLLGKPMPGWQVKVERRSADVESWYYRTTDGGVAGVYFREGKLFAAEEDSHAKVTRFAR